jgi:hypothetical protein
MEWEQLRHIQEIIQIGIDVDALYNEYSRLRLALPTLHKE